jgi:hypothetical protein
LKCNRLSSCVLTLGKGEVESSILSCSTIIIKYLQCNSAVRSAVYFLGRPIYSPTRSPLKRQKPALPPHLSTSSPSGLKCAPPARYKPAMSYRPPPRHLPPQVAPQPLPADPMAATIRDLSGWWMEVRCVCGRHTDVPLRLMCAKLWPARPTIAEVSKRLRCGSCGDKPSTINLLERAGANPMQGPQVRELSCHNDQSSVH